MSSELLTGLSRRHFLKGMGAGVLGMATPNSLQAAAALLESPEQSNSDGVRRMGGNENPVGPSPKAIQAVASQLSGLNWYPYQPDLELAIHRFHGIEPVTSTGTGWAGLNTTFIKDSNVITGIGSTEVLRAAAWAYLIDGGHVIQGRPSYTEISDTGRKLGDRVSVSLVDLNDDLSYNLDAMRSAVQTSTKIISLCNPNNPTGLLLSQDQISNFLDSISKDILIVIDEAYIHFVEDTSYQHAVSHALTRPNVLVTRTFSKGYGIAGLRVGYGIAHSEIIKRLRPYTLGPLGMHSNSIAGAIAALEDEDHLELTRKTVVAGRDYLKRELNELGMRPVSGEGNFVLVDTGKDSNAVFEHLLNNRILVTPGTRWNMPTYIRISVGLHNDNEAIIKALKTM